jgi:uncharacterized protein YndB with AHSA1/START domain
MRILKGLFVFVVVLVVACIALGFLLPKTSHLERATTTTASPEAVYAVVSGFGRFNEWSPWASLDPQTKYTYSGPDRGVGARMEWHSDDPDVGSGSQQIIAVEPDRSVTTQLDFGPHGKPVSRMTLTPDGSGTHIVWSMDSDFSDNFLGRYFGPLLDRMVGPDYEKGLAQLKRLVEVAPPADAPPISEPGADSSAPETADDAAAAPTPTSQT